MPGSKPIPLEKRFWTKVDIRGKDECWPWMRALNEHGYGVVGAGGPHNILAHRAAYQLTHNVTLTPKQEIAHTCDNPPCCNPAHLFVATHKENMMDMKNKKRAKGPYMIGSKHPLAILDEADVVIIKKLIRMKVTLREIAKQFDVPYGCITHISNGSSWKHVK